jgi:hypothetical protein
MEPKYFHALVGDNFQSIYINPDLHRLVIKYIFFNSKMENLNQKEEEIIKIIKEHYQNCDGKPRPLNALKKHYGPGPKFESLGMGKYGTWMQHHSHPPVNETKAATIVQNIDIDSITEQQLLTTVTLYFSISEYYTHRRHILNHIREIYGNGPFSQFGYGTFKEFMVRYNLDIGIARRKDFRSLSEWKSWKGRKE